MNDKTNYTDEDIKRIASEELKKQLKTLDFDTKLGQQQKEFEDFVGVTMDYERTAMLVLKYFIKLEARYINLTLALQDAIMDFNTFLNLPRSSNNLSAYWDTAWAALATFLPMLRVFPAWVKLEKAAEAELKAANYVLQDRSIQTKLITYGSRVHNIGDWMNKENSLYARLRDVETKTPKVDMARTPIKAMMEENNAAHKTLEKVVEAIWAEFKARVMCALARTQFPRTEPLEKMADRLLPKLSYLEQDEADQVERSFLDQILTAWAPRNVAIVTTVYRTGQTVTIRGLNDTQQEQIMAWFGPGSNWAGGTVPVFPAIYNYLYRWNVPRKKESSGGAAFGYG